MQKQNAFILNGQSLTPLGFGTWTMADKKGRDLYTKAQNLAAIRHALKRGLMVSGARVYGDGETDAWIGEAARDFPDAVLTSKLDEPVLKDPARIPATTENIAKQFGRNTIDLLYVHWPYPGTTMESYLPAMFKLIDQGLVEAIGVSNFNLAQLKQATRIAKTCGHQIAAIENVYSLLNPGGGMHITVGLPQPGFDTAMRAYCREHGVLMAAYTSLAKGKVAELPLVQAIAQKHDATPIQVALAWVIAQGIMPLAKSSRPERIDEMLGALDVELTPHEIVALNKIAVQS